MRYKLAVFIMRHLSPYSLSFKFGHWLFDWCQKERLKHGDYKSIHPR